MLKAWFSYVGKIPDDQGFYFLPTIPDFSDISDNRQKSVPYSREMLCLFVIGGLELSKLGGWYWAKSIADVRDGAILSFHLSGMIADHRRNLGRVGKIETLQILQICPRPSQTIGDIYDFEFSLVGKIWDSRETVKCPIVWDFPDVWAFDDFKKWQDRVYFARITRAFQLTCWMTFIFARNWLVITISWKNYNRLESLLVKYTCVQMLN